MSDSEKHDHIEIRIVKAVLLYPSVYEGRMWEGGKDLRFGVGFTTEEADALEQLALNRIVAKRDGIFNSNSLFRPMVTERNSNYTALRNAFEIADMRNIKRDRLLVNIEADLHLRVFSYDYQGIKGNGLALLGIGLNAANLESTALNLRS